VKKNRVLWSYFGSILRKWRVGRAVEHLSGTLRPRLSDADVVLLCVVRNGEDCIEHFLRHHFSLGISHAVLIDNGSTDDTCRIAGRHGRVTLLRCLLPFRHFKMAMIEWMMGVYGRRRWCLIVDIDEFFDYQGSDVVTIPELTSYLDGKGFTAVVAQMLDMFSEKLERRPERSFSPAEQRNYELKNIVGKPYAEFSRRCTVSNQDIAILFGGVRQRLFGIKSLCLSKHPLIRRVGGTRLLNEHFVGNAVIADFSCLLRHYKFTPGFYDHILLALEEKQHFKESAEYRQYFNVLGKTREKTLLSKDTKELRDISELVAEGFLTISPSYREWLASRPSRPAASSGGGGETDAG